MYKSGGYYKRWLGMHDRAMQYRIMVNGKEGTIELGHEDPVKQLKMYVSAMLTDWLSAEVFVPNYPRHGEYLDKVSGSTEVVRGGKYADKPERIIVG